MLKAVEPAALELSLRAAERAEQDPGRLHTHWRQRLERAEYEADRAMRQYDAVEPENRLVARALEQRWEAKLAEQRRLGEDYARFQAEQPRHLSASDRERIGALAADLPVAEGGWPVRVTTKGSDAARAADSAVASAAGSWNAGIERPGRRFCRSVASRRADCFRRSAPILRPKP